MSFLSLFLYTILSYGTFLLLSMTTRVYLLIVLVLVMCNWLQSCCSMCVGTSIVVITLHLIDHHLSVCRNNNQRESKKDLESPSVIRRCEPVRVQNEEFKTPGTPTSSSRARFPYVETVLEQLVQDPFREFFGSTLGPTIFGRLIHCCLCRSLLVLIPNSGPTPVLVLDLQISRLPQLPPFEFGNSTVPATCHHLDPEPLMLRNNDECLLTNLSFFHAR